MFLYIASPPCCVGGPNRAGRSSLSGLLYVVVGLVGGAVAVGVGLQRLLLVRLALHLVPLLLVSRAEARVHEDLDHIQGHRHEEDDAPRVDRLLQINYALRGFFSNEKHAFKKYLVRSGSTKH